MNTNKKDNLLMLMNYDFNNTLEMILINIIIIKMFFYLF